MCAIHIPTGRQFWFTVIDYMLIAKCIHHVIPALWSSFSSGKLIVYINRILVVVVVVVAVVVVVSASIWCWFYYYCLLHACSSSSIITAIDRNDWW